MKAKVLFIWISMLSCYLTGCSSRKELSWQTYSVKHHNMTEMVSATGTVEPVTKVDVGTQVSGIIDKIYVDYNSIVKKGQLIAEMDKIVLQAELESQEAQLANTKAEFEYQQKNYNRSKILFEKTLISDTEYELAVYNYDKAKSAYDKAQADIVKVRRNLGYAVITSPIDGVVISREVEEGQTVAAGFSTPTLFTIAKDLTEMQVVANVDEADIGQVEEGQRVTFVVDAYPNDVFEGKVTQVRLEATIESNVVTYEVVISAPNLELKLKPGLTATVSICTIEKLNVLIIPPKALKFVPDAVVAETGGITVKSLHVENSALQKTVWVRNGMLLEEKEIRIGITTSSMVEILKGVEEGAEIITGMEIMDKNITNISTTGQESSPFMPKRPGSEKKTKS